jgi:hypothetical protein
MASGDPVVDALLRDLETAGDFAHLPAVLGDGEYRLKSLLHDA